MPVTAEQIQRVRNDLMLLLSQYGTRHGYHFQIGTIRYNDNSFRMKLESTCTAPQATPVQNQESELAVAKQDFERRSFRYGIPQELFGQDVTLNDSNFYDSRYRGNYKVVGLSPRGKLIIQNNYGRKYKINYSSVQSSIHGTVRAFNYAERSAALARRNQSRETPDDLELRVD